MLIKGKPILVTGCAGFIGWRVSEKLLESGCTVVGVDNLNDYYDVRLKLWRLARLQRSAQFEFLREDITQFEAMDGIFQRHEFTAVINLAARAGVRASVEDPWIYYDTNVKGTLNLLECCRRHGVGKLVLASSSSVYGLTEMPFRESDDTDRALSPYAATKKAAEVLCHSYSYLHNLDITALRFFTVYGPGGRPDMSIFKFLKGIYEGTTIEVFGDGTQKRDFTFIDDIADGVVKSVEPPGFEIFNLGSSNAVELSYVISLLETMLGRKAEIRYVPRHSADVLATLADIGKARSILGWSPKTGIEDGLQKSVDWFLEYYPQMREEVGSAPRR